MSLCVTGIVIPDVLKGYTAFIFRVKLCKEKCGFVCVELHIQIHLHGCIVLGLPDPEDEGTMTLQNILSCTLNDTE